MAGVFFADLAGVALGVAAFLAEGFADLAGVAALDFAAALTGAASSFLPFLAGAALAPAAFSAFPDAGLFLPTNFSTTRGSPPASPPLALTALAFFFSRAAAAFASFLF